MIKRLENIEISENDVSEYDKSLKVVVIPRDKIYTITLEYGFSEERPIISISFGFVTICLGVWFGLLPILRMLLRFINGEHVYGNVGIFAFSVPLLFIGGWFIIKAFRYSYFLKVATIKTTRKMSFGKSIEKTTVQSFIEECNAAFGYNIYLNI